MDIHPVTLESWPTMQLPPEEVKATLQYLAHKAQKPVSFRWYTEGEGYTPNGVSVLTAEAFQQLFAYAYATASEISCMGAVRREDNTFIVERFHLVKQEGGMAHTEMDPTALGELMEELLAQGQAQEARSLKCWAHSHPGMGVFWSKTDDTTCRLLASDYLVSLVVSDDFAVRARIDTADPLAFSVDNVPVLCQASADKAKVEQYEKEVAEKVKAASRTLFGDIARQGSGPAVADNNPFSEYFGIAYRLFDEEDTAEVDVV